MDKLFTDAARQLLTDLVTPERIRAVEAGGPHKDLWDAIECAGYADALVPETHGGAGLRVGDVFGVMELCGEFAVVVPLAETIIARGFLTAANIPVPVGSMVIAEGQRDCDGSIRCSLVRSGRVADQVLVQVDHDWYVLPVSAGEATQSVFCLDVSICWNRCVTERVTPMLLPATDSRTVRAVNAMIAAAMLSGALRSVFHRTLKYANDRCQFGRSIGKFQAIQHQLAIMSEHVFSARMAALVGCTSESLIPDQLRVAVAKARTSEAALVIAELSHSIHGAIGFTEECDLQLFTRRLHAWRQTAGAESYWHEIAGYALIHEHTGLTLDLIRIATEFSSKEY